MTLNSSSLSSSSLYRIEEETRHAYNLVIIYKNLDKGIYSPPVGTLRFDANKEGDKEKELWIKMIMNFGNSQEQNGNL